MCTKTETLIIDDHWRIILTGTSPYLAKDQRKSDMATKFIGRGTAYSSTARYAKDWGDRANTGSYNLGDVVFISAEGKRRGHLSIDVVEIQKAIDGQARFVTDGIHDRNREYNVGERQVAFFLNSKGYKDHKGLGLWSHPIYHPEFFKKD